MEKVVEYLSTWQQLLEEGFSDAEITSAVSTFDHNSTTVATFLRAHRRLLQEFEFPDLKIKEALLMTGNNFENAIQYLCENTSN